MRRVVRMGARGALLALVALVGIEGSLQVIAQFATDRRSPWRPGAFYRVLCVGDSHTYGAGVRAEEAYPAQLQAHLDRLLPGVYSVMNLGVPGFNSALVRDHLPAWIAELAPSFIVAVVGVNNTWNLSDADDVGDWRSRLAAWADRLRVVRFVESWRAHRALDAELDHSNLPFGSRPKYALGEHATVELGGVQEPVSEKMRPGLVDEDAVARARRDYEQMARTAEAHGVLLVFLGYPEPNPIFLPFTTAMREVAALHHLPFVDGFEGVRRLSPGRMTWTFGAHAGPAGLTEIARDVAQAILAHTPPAVHATTR